MDVVAFAEGFRHIGILAEMGHDAELYLWVVGRKEQTAWLRNEASSYLSSVVIAYWDILQVGVTGWEASCRCNGLVERGVNATCTRVDEFGQGVYIGAEEFL